MRIVIPILLLTLLSGCGGVSREARIEGQLEKAGVKPRLARCMAGKLDRGLSDDELGELKAAVKRRPGGGRLNAGEIAARLDAVDDPHVVDVVSRAALGCAILG